MKRARTVSQPSRVTLNVGGTRFETSSVTLGSSPYFASLLNGDWQERDGDEIFIDRDPQLFAHVLDWLRTAHMRIPTYQADPSLWKALRIEAEYFCVETLISWLHVTHRCRFQATGRGEKQGLLYWLGTAKGTNAWSNPHLSGVVRVESDDSVQVDANGNVAMCGRALFQTTSNWSVLFRGSQSSIDAKQQHGKVCYRTCCPAESIVLFQR